MNAVLTDSYLNECLKQARYYEFCKDSDRALTVLAPVWKNIEEPPDIDRLSDIQAWEVQLVCGSVISAYGTSNQIKHYQELAADILTCARETAIKIGKRDLIAESEKQIAIAYWRHGQYDNAVAFLNTALSKYSEAEQLTNSVCLYAQSNLLMLHVAVGQMDVAMNSLKKINTFVDDSADLWLKTGFYNQASGVFVYAGNFEQAIPFLEKAVQYATAAKNNTYLGNALNNLSNAYINLQDSKKAMYYADRAIDLFISTNQVYPYAQVLETKALIHIERREFKKALLVIDESITILRKGENYGELCLSLWTKIIVLIRIGEKRQSLRLFHELLQITNEHLSLLAGDQYIDKFNDLVYVHAGNDFEQNEIEFRKYQLDKGLTKCGGLITPTAKLLGLKHQTLSKMVGKFPDLKEKHSVKLINRTTDSILPRKVGKSKKNSQTSFALKLNSDGLGFIGLHKGQVVNVQILLFDELDLSKPVCIKDSRNDYHCGFLVDMFGLFAFQSENGDIQKTFLNSDIIEAGQIVGVHDPNTDRFVPLSF